MAKFIWLALFFISAASVDASAAQVAIKITVEQNGDYVSIDPSTAQGDGWIAGDEDSGSYSFAKVLDSKDLPFRAGIGVVEFSLSKDGQISVGASVGDSDASAEGEFTLPVDKQGNLIPLSQPIRVRVSGGDHASGTWYFDSTMEITVSE